MATIESEKQRKTISEILSLQSSVTIYLQSYQKLINDIEELEKYLKRAKDIDNRYTNMHISQSILDYEKEQNTISKIKELLN